MYRVKLESSRNKQLRRGYWTRIGLFIAGAAVGAAAVNHIYSKERNLLLDNTKAKSAIIAEMEKSTVDNIKAIADLSEDNLTLKNQNQELWREHARILKRKAKYSVVLKRPDAVKLEPDSEQPAASPAAAPSMADNAQDAKKTAPAEDKKGKGFFGRIFH